MKFFESLKIAGYRFRDSSKVVILSFAVSTVEVKDASAGKDIAPVPNINPSQITKCRIALKVLFKGI
tara:strand:+ start:385 stop:585 length:201 start_codon:yes stop_codon:yes gene_type:complete